jgi:hypothetical protein
MLGREGGWESNTILASTDAFKRQFTKLSKDRSTGTFSGTKNFRTPDAFDGRVVWAKYIKPVRNQGTCGACWAFASAFALQTRLAIATGGAYNLDLSPAAMVLCNMGSDHEFELAKTQIERGEPYDFNLPAASTDVRRKEKESIAMVGCAGETLLGAWQYLYRFGVPEESCVTYDDKGDDNVDLSGNGGMPTCADTFGDQYEKCPASGEWRQSHLAVGYYHVPGAPTTAQDDMESGNEGNIRRNIFHWGPVTTGFDVYDDFMSWDGQGVYRWNNSGKPLGGHAVVLVGWGDDPAHGAFWVVRNSWGKFWGEAGYFRFARGVNNCNIEENVIVGLPNLYGYRLYLEWPLLHRTEDLALRALWGVHASGYKTTTLERMVVGSIAGNNTKLYQQQYDPRKWPDVSVLVAGDPSTLHFRLAESCNPFSHPLRYASLHTEFIAGVAVGACALVIVGLGVTIVIKMRKRNP